MEIKLLGPGPRSLGLKPLDQHLQKYFPRIKHDGIFYLATALVDLSSLEFLQKHIPNLRKKGVETKAVIGVDIGISIKALKEIRRLFGERNVFIYHNPADSAFHLKLFVLKVSHELGIVVVGSSNLTAAGLSKNFEMNICLELNLRRDTDYKLFNTFLNRYVKILSSISTLPLTSSLISKLSQKPVPRVSKIMRPVKLQEIFKGETHGWEMPASPRIFLMTLSYNDVSGIRADPYVRIPVNAVKDNPDFWGWKDLFAPSPRAKKLERILDVIYLGKKFPRRMYFVDPPDEFRLVMPEIYNLGKKYIGSVLKITRMNSRYKLEVFTKNQGIYENYLRLCRSTCPRGKARVPKVWGYK